MSPHMTRLKLRGVETLGSRRTSERRRRPTSLSLPSGQSVDTDRRGYTASHSPFSCPCPLRASAFSLRRGLASPSHADWGHLTSPRGGAGLRRPAERAVSFEKKTRQKKNTCGASRVSLSRAIVLRLSLPHRCLALLTLT